MEQWEIELEKLVDTNSLHEVTRALTDICTGKADHLRDNWQDENASKVWLKAAKLVDHASAKIFELPLP